MLKNRIALLLILFVFLMGVATQGGVPVAFGFGIRTPCQLPIDWEQSFSFLSSELLSHQNLTFMFALGTYPYLFPNIVETQTDIVVKGWMGPLAFYAGGGIALQWKPVGDMWSWNAYVHVTAGTQLWLIDTVNLTASVSSLDTLPPTWTLSPKFSLGLNFSLCPARPSAPEKENGFYLWLVVGLIIAGLFVHYQHI